MANNKNVLNSYVTEWSYETYGAIFNLDTMLVSQLAEKLAKFYCEARPKQQNHSSSTSEKIYHKNTLLNLRSGINRFIQNTKRLPIIDIAKDTEFKIANGVLDGLLKERMKSGTAVPTRHKQIIEQEDLDKIHDYFQRSFTSPIILRQCVWFQLAVHFVSRGLELHHQLRVDSFEFDEDESGHYAKLRHDTQMKNNQGGLSSLVNAQEATEKRMYATGTGLCPVKMLKYLIDKTDKKCTHLFNKYLQEAELKPNLEIWFCPVPLAKRTFSKFLADICKSASVKNRYTAHCLRATAIQHLSNQGFETRHIMFMSSHKNEASINSYSRNVSAKQKKSMSGALSFLCAPETVLCEPETVLCEPERVGPNIATATVVKPSVELAKTHPQSQTFEMSKSQTTSVGDTHSVLNPGIFAGSNFYNCTFNFNN